MTIAGSGGGPYHCSIHPVMIGSINQDRQTATLCQGADCD